MNQEEVDISNMMDKELLSLIILKFSKKKMNLNRGRDKYIFK